MWLDNDPREPMSEDMPLTLQMTMDLCSVERDDLPIEERKRDLYTFTTCIAIRSPAPREAQRRVDSTFRTGRCPHLAFSYPYQKIRGRGTLQGGGRQARYNFENKSYETILDFFRNSEITSLEMYADVIRSYIVRPTIMHRRDMTQIMTNTFNPFISSALDSNMNLQIILETISIKPISKDDSRYASISTNASEPSDAVTSGV
jgi:hypothetical protein